MENLEWLKNLWKAEGLVTVLGVKYQPLGTNNYHKEYLKNSLPINFGGTFWSVLHRDGKSELTHLMSCLSKQQNRKRFFLPGTVTLDHTASEKQRRYYTPF